MRETAGGSARTSPGASLYEANQSWDSPHASTNLEANQLLTIKFWRKTPSCFQRQKEQGPKISCLIKTKTFEIDKDVFVFLINFISALYMQSFHSRSDSIFYKYSTKSNHNFLSILFQKRNI